MRPLDHDNRPEARGNESGGKPAKRREVALADEWEKAPDVEIGLKNGTRHDPGLAAATRDTLSQLGGRKPDLLRAAHALACGEGQSPAVLRELRRAVLATTDGDLRPVVRDVLLSGYRETSEGPIIADPFSPQTEAERQAVVASERIADRNALRLFGYDPPPDDGPGRR